MGAEANTTMFTYSSSLLPALPCKHQRAVRTTERESGAHPKVSAASAVLS
jgi:hypothetical protein